MVPINVDFLKPYAKAVVAALSAAVVIASTITDGLIVSNELESIVTAVAAIVAVYRVPNKPAA